MSIAASWVALGVLLLRFLLKKAPKWITVLLWAVVAIRLVCPFTLESRVSLIPSGQTISPHIITDTVPQVQTAIPAVDQVVNPIIEEPFAPNLGDSMNSLQFWIPAASILWGIGVLAMLLYGIISYLRVKKKVATAIRFRDHIYQSEAVASPFVLGTIFPRIYLPFSMPKWEMFHVIAHEEAHIRRMDHCWKPISFLLLSLHWFNPLMWLAYVLLCRDIELACDEKVVKTLSTEDRADYSQALLNCSVGRRVIAFCPLAFGEVDVRDRVKSVLSYKKPTFWILLIGIALSALASLCFLTNPTQEKLGELGFIGRYESEQRFYAWISDGERFSSAGEVSFESLKSLLDLDISKKPFALSHSPNRDKSHTIVLQEAVLISESLYPTNLYEEHIHFNSDFTSVWLNDGTDPTVSYKVTEPDRAREIFDRIEQGNIPLPIAKEREQISDPSVDLELLRAKLPMYFDLDLSQGLDLYIWVSESGKDCFGLLPGNSEYTISALKELYGNPAYEKEIQAILSQYLSGGQINRDSVFIKLFHAPIHSYVLFHHSDSRYLSEYRFWERYDLRILPRGAKLSASDEHYIV